MTLIHLTAPISPNLPDHLYTLSGKIFLWTIRLLESIGFSKPHRRYAVYFFFSLLMDVFVHVSLNEPSEKLTPTPKLIISLNTLTGLLPNKPNGPVIEAMTWGSLLICDADWASPCVQTVTACTVSMRQAFHLILWNIWWLLVILEWSRQPIFGWGEAGIC